MGGGRWAENPAKGSPDIIAILPGSIFLGIEVKSAGGKLKPHQEAWHDDARAKGQARLIVARSIEDVRQEIDLVIGPETFVGKKRED